MESTLYIAKLMGPILLFVGMGLFISTGFYKKLIHSFLNERALIMVSSIVSATAGLAILNTHNTWSTAPEMIITFIGFALLIKAALFLIIPNILLVFVENMKYSKLFIKFIGILYISFGLYLTMFTYT